MTYEFNIDIGLDSSDKFEALEPFLPYADFNTEWGQSMLSVMGDKARKLVLAYKGKSDNDLQKICELEQLPYQKLRSITNDSRMSLFNGFFIVVSVLDLKRLDKLESEFRSNQPYIDYTKAENRVKILVRSVIADNLYPIIIGDQIDRAGWTGNIDDWRAEKQDDLWIATNNRLPKLDSKDWHYQIYLNDRMMIQRIMMPGLPLDRKVWQEQLSFSKVPAEGFNFRLETNLNIQFNKVDLNGIVTQPMDKSFSVNP